jgi:8-oxo-dGTP pyrophosphatase MutT (NUDIX family)
MDEARADDVPMTAEAVLAAAALSHRAAGLDAADEPALTPPPPDTRPAAGILFITKTGDALYLHRADGKDHGRTWGLPGGHANEGEPLEKCARREAAEETGLSYDGPLTKLYDDGHFTTFLARVDHPFPVTLCAESTGYSWAAQPPAPAHPGMANVLRVLRADTELSVAELMRDGVLPSPQIYHNIYLLALRITGTGMAYRSKGAEHVYRDATLYHNEEFLARCNGLPVILEHPAGSILDGKEFEERIAGTIMFAYVKGDDVDGIARIYAKDAIERLEDARLSGTPISTSPAVVFAQTSENVKVTLENGSPLLIEGKPALLDHLAICGLGVWDKGGPASGVTLDNEDLHMADEKDPKADAAKADAEKARDDAAKADAEKAAKFDAMCAKFDAMCNKMDAMEMADAKRKADAEKEEKEKADAAKADAAKADAAKADAAKADSVTDSAKFADAQAHADSVYSMLGGAAPRPMAGEALTDYRVRLLRGLQTHSAAFKDSDLGAVARADSVAFAGVETQILADAKKFANTPVAIADGALVPTVRRTEAGHTVTTYRGDPFVWLSPFMQTPKRVRISTRDELSARH